MKQLLLLILTYFLCIGSSFAQDEYSEDNGMELPYFQNDRMILKNKIEIYPNPAVDNIFVRIDNSELEKVEFELFNIIGNSLDIKPEEISKNNYRISVDEFPPGYYLLYIKDPITRFNQAFKFHKVK